MTDQTNSQSLEAREQEAFAQLDTERVRQAIVPDVERLAEQKAQELVEKAREEWQKDLARKLAGEERPSRQWSGVDSKGRPAPTSHDEIVEAAKRETRDEILREIEKRDKEREKVETQKQQSFQQRQQEMVKMWDKDIYELQQEGLIPQYSEDVRKKIENRISLTQDDFEKDPGLRARAELFRTAQEKGTSPFKAFYKYANRKPSGSNAPVFGGMSGNNYSGDRDEYSYDEIVKLREQLMNN